MADYVLVLEMQQMLRERWQMTPDVTTFSALRGTKVSNTPLRIKAQSQEKYCFTNFVKLIFKLVCASY